MEVVEVFWSGSSLQALVATTSAEVEDLIASDADADLDVVGFDTEWGGNGEVALVQIATRTQCLLCPLPEVVFQDCPKLLALLENPRILKSGVSIAVDAQLMQKQYDISVRGCLDLSLLAAREGEVSGSQPVGLAALTKLLVGCDLPKDQAVRRSNWSQRPLKPEQVEYAARDALAGRDCALALAKKYRPSKTSFVEWCGELVDRDTKKRRMGKGKKEQGQIGGPANKTAKGALECGAYSCVAKFGLRKVLSSSGEPLLHMKERTVEGLLRRGLATLFSEGEEEIVRLHFTPADHYEYAGLDVAERNACVGCGARGVARFYIIPRLFFTHLPDKCKSYNCHDVVMLCPKCRSKVEPAQLALTQDLLAANGALKAGSLYANENSLSSEEVSAKKAAVALKRSRQGANRLPSEKEAALREAVAVGINKCGEELTEADLNAAEALGSGPLPSERIVTVAVATVESLTAFLRRWRSLFVDVLHPQYLAEGWSLDTGLDGRFVPSVASSLEWPGDWRCPTCGVHCFGRSSVCRSCKAQKQDVVDAVEKAVDS
mmetsp:Transcript_40782/g.93903  ORF Transcript_40782/g.93903 Transcript_40782/m.93903 type:complete len:547 (-) Transcript_40782:27-1667(-)